MADENKANSNEANSAAAAQAAANAAGAAATDKENTSKETSKSEDKGTVIIGGVEYTPEQLTAKLAQADTLNSSMKTLLDGQANASQREAAARTVLSKQGYTETDINAWIAVNIKGEDPTTNQTTPQNDGKLDEVKRIAVDARKRQLNDVFSKAVDDAIKSKDLGIFVKRSIEINGESKTDEVRKFYVEQVSELALQNIRRKTRETGTSIDEDLIESEVEKAKAEVAKKMPTALGDPSSWAESADTAGANQRFSFKQPVKAPDMPSNRKGWDSVDDDLTKWATDKLERAGASFKSAQ